MKNGYQMKRLGDVCEVFADGDWIESKDQSQSGVRLIQTGNVGNGFFKNRINKARYISELTFKNLRCTEIFRGDYLISRLPEPVGRTCVLPDINTKMITAVDCTIVRFNFQKIIQKYFLFYSQSNQYLQDVDEETTGTTRKRISRKKLANIKIPLPPLPEQQRIVTKLDALFANIDILIHNTEQNLANAKELFRSTLHGVFTNAGDDWQMKRLGEVFKKGSSNISIKQIKKDEGKYSVYGAKGLIKTISFYQQENEYLAVIKDGAGIGRISKHPQKSSVIATMQYLLPQQGFNIDFLFYYLIQVDLKKYRVGSTIPHIYYKDYQNENIYTPPLPEQQRIVAKLDALSQKTQELEAIYKQKLSDLKELKQSILKKAFDGEL